jgi:predicted component of type VI protein secretion system
MREPIDTKTGDLLPAHDLAGERPAQPSRLDKMRSRRGLRGLSVNLPAELVDQFHAKRKERGQTANEAIEKLLRTQFLRKR